VLQLEVSLRSPETVMRLDRLGSFHQCRLSFMRTLLRRLKRENWTFDRPIFDIDTKGVGTAVYSAHGPERSYSLVCFGHDLPPEQRSDRVIATAWDSTFTLFDGIPTTVDIQRLRNNIPKQEAGRVSYHELSVSRANRSVRLFNHVVESLAAGNQPDSKQVRSVGYLMRTSAVYGSGKLGAADRDMIAERPEFSAPFQPEMLSVFLTRAYTLDLVEHMAYLRSPNTAVKIESCLRRRFAVGNSTGLGMAPFLINHPSLMHNWILAKETALSRVRQVARATVEERSLFRIMLARAQSNTNEWVSDHELQKEKLIKLKADLQRLQIHIEKGVLVGEQPWNELFKWSEENLSLEGQEQLVSLMFEPYGELVDDLTDSMSIDESTQFVIDGSMSTTRLISIVEDVYQFALKLHWSQANTHSKVWYISEEKQEPRLGERFEEELTCYEQKLSPGRDAAQMYGDLLTWETQTEKVNTVAAFLLQHPKHRHIVRRAQITDRLPYAEIRDNTISSRLLPIDLLRCKLSFFGATHFDPRSDRWLRINMFQGAPFPNELSVSDADDWSYPTLPKNNSVSRAEIA
jgi:hypothetical protein